MPGFMMWSTAGFDLRSGVIAKRSLVIARVEDGLGVVGVGGEKLSRNLLQVIGSGGCRMEGV